MKESEYTEGVIQVVMLDVLRPAFEEWLESRGFVLGRLPMDDPEELPTYCVGIGDKLAGMQTGGNNGRGTD